MKLKTVLPISAVFAISIMALSIISFSPIAASADYDKYHDIPEITGSITIEEESDDYSDQANIAFTVAMAVAENSVDDGKVMWGKLGVVQGYLVYKFGVLGNDDLFYKAIIDAGNGETLYVSDGISKDKLGYHKHSDKGSKSKWKEQYEKLTPEEREEKKRQWGEMKDAFFSLSIEDRATMMLHFMQMKTQWNNMSEDEKAAQRAEMKEMMQEILPLPVEEKIEKLQEFADSLRQS